MRKFAVLTVGLVAALAARPLYAQNPASILVQGTVGAGTSEGGRYVEREEYALELMLGGRLPTRKVPLILGFALGQSMVNGSDLTCEIAPGGGCVPMMPRFGYIALLAGIEAHGRAGTISGMAGPALVSAQGSGALSSRSGMNSFAQVGAQFRLDIVSPSVFHVAIALSPKLLLVPNVDGAALTLRSFNVGVRLR
jgi:hypothetical protein